MKIGKCFHLCDYVLKCFECFVVLYVSNSNKGREQVYFFFFFSCPKCFRVFFDTFTSLVLDRDN